MEKKNYLPLYIIENYAFQAVTIDTCAGWQVYRVSVAQLDRALAS